MKKIISLLLCVAMLCAISVSMVGCGDDDHKHSYGSWSVTKAATCTEDGERTRKCSCGDVQTETVDAKGHNMVGGVCTDCGETE